ncbi:PHD finger protein 7-like isoform X2 [Varroa jacobsoni]|uniref:PHD finger protein 7-like isoform X2 n=1 Tax=Varroa jacobsoni TaxID=62625 RepID=UPI000BF24DF2|nr:PHD finger protein 7-like isoform X2 [Varroa jacobsoni]
MEFRLIHEFTQVHKSLREAGDQLANASQLHQDTCVFCRRPIRDDENLIFGQRESSLKHTVHYFCMLLSSQLPQKGQDEEGIKGFLDVDIAKEVRRSQKDKCCYCRKPGANVRCAKASCRRVFHFPCAYENDSIADFNQEAFDVLCGEHARPQVVVPLTKPDGTAECLVCLETIRINPSVSISSDFLVSPCCRQLYEKRCLRGYAKVAGLHHFKCCQCRNVNQFLYACQQNGIFVPNQDAEWERSNEFADHYIPHSVCDVPICLCPNGRQTTDGHPDWEVVRCDDCGKSGTHIKCSDLQDGPMSAYRCQDCECIGNPSVNSSVPASITGVSSATNEHPEIIEVDDDGDDDDDDENDCDADSDVVVVSSTYTAEDIAQRRKADQERLQETYSRFRSIIINRLVESLRKQRHLTAGTSNSLKSVVDRPAAVSDGFGGARHSFREDPVVASAGPSSIFCDQQSSTSPGRTY